jgi:hypothetical protein
MKGRGSLEPYDEIVEAVVVEKEVDDMPFDEPSDSELAEIEEEEVAFHDPPLTVYEWLDREDLDRLEYDRIVDDLYPDAVSDGGQMGHIHRDTDPVQSWMQEMRRL